MQVKLNAWRGEHGPGEIVDLDARDAEVMIAHGTAWAVDDLEEELVKAEAEQPATGRVVKGSATLASTSGVEHAEP